MLTDGLSTTSVGAFVGLQSKGPYSSNKPSFQPDMTNGEAYVPSSLANTSPLTPKFCQLAGHQPEQQWKKRTHNNWPKEDLLQAMLKLQTISLIIIPIAIKTKPHLLKNNIDATLAQELTAGDDFVPCARDNFTPDTKTSSPVTSMDCF